MIAHLKYFRYVFLHKLFVFLECCRLGIPLAGILHDWSKFLPDEFLPYARNFYGPKYPSIFVYSGDMRNHALDTGHYKEAVRDAFDLAWLKHQRRSAHHWQAWVLINDSDPPKALEMPDRYRREMVADWRGAGRAQGKTDTRGWYLKNRTKIQLGPETREWVERELGVLASMPSPMSTR